MEKSNDFKYDLENIPQSVLDELDRQQDGNNPCFDTDKFFKENNILPIVKQVQSDKSPELSESDKAVSLLDALRLDLQASKLVGLTTAVESSHPNVNNRFDSSRIDENMSKEKLYRSRANEAFRRAIGGTALKMAGYNNVDEASDEYLIGLPDRFYNDFTGKENAPKRAKLRRKLNKLVKQDN